MTLDGLIGCVNRQLEPPWSDEVAPELVYSLHGHVDRLVAIGDATRYGGADGRLVYRRVE
jgi:hypothetical protein